MLTTVAHDCLQVQRRQRRLVLGLLLVALPTLGQVPTGTATFVKTDISTAGTWKGVYGADGFNVIGDSASVPGYVTVTPSGNGSWVWASSTSDTRALQKASSPADRMAACWYSPGQFTIDLAFHDSNTHPVALYLVDWDNFNGRAERVDVIDASNNLLDTRSVSSFTGGQYLVWNLSGHVILRITNTKAPNAVVSGLFFGAGGSVAPALPPTGTATFVRTDISTAGTWKGVYGTDGFNVIGNSASVPAYVTVTPSGSSSYVWANSTSDTRALQTASNPADRIAACWYSSGSFTIDLAFHDSNTHQVAAYLLDWDNYYGRSERVDVMDANNNLLDSRSVSSFTGGQYLVWNLSGHVILRVTNTNAPSNAVIGGLFFGASGLVPAPLPPTGAATFVRTDISTAGTWKGVYGADGFNVIGNSASVPAYVTVTPSGSSSYLWASSTGDTRALQTASNPADRMAACWYSPGQFTIDLAFHDSNTHQVAAYLLDWDNSNGRTERVDVIDANNTLLDTRSVSNFRGGQYLIWNLSGHVILRVTNTNAPSNAVISGLFFGTLQPTVSVSVSPSSVNLLAGGSQQFSATVLGSANTSVTWWVNPAVGTISSGGLYTAPATLSSPQTVTVTATSTANANNQAAATVTITPPVTVSLTPTAATMLPAQGQTFTVTVGGTSNSGVKWSMAPATGTISSSGLYTAPPAILSTSSVMVTATSAADATKSASAAITLIPAITIMRTSQLSGTAGTAYSAAVSAIGGVTPYTWSIASGQLPPGTSLSTSTGAISGTPTTAGSYNVTMKVTDAAGYQATAVLAIVIAAASCTTCPPLGITTTTLPPGTVGSAYGATLAVTGGTSPYTWSISAGQLPPGVTLSSATGVISGAPSTTGSYSFTAMVTDSASPQKTASQALPLTVGAIDAYGGKTSVTCAGGATGVFYTELISPQWYLCTPLGHPVWIQGAYGVSPQGNFGSKYGSVLLGFQQTIARLKAWGFNVLPPYSNGNLYPYQTWMSSYQMPYIPIFRPGFYGMQLNAVAGPLSDAIKDLGNGSSSYFIPYAGGGIVDWADTTRLTSALHYMLRVDANDFATVLNNKESLDYIVGIAIEDSDQTGGFWAAGGNDPFDTQPSGMGPPHGGYITATMSGQQQSNAMRALLYSDHTVYTKANWHTYLQTKYTTIAALNTAWGSSYTTFGTSGATVRSESFATTDGIHASFTHTLADAGTVSPNSIQIYEDGTMIAGDCFQPNTGNACNPTHGTTWGGIYGPTASGGTINYSTKSATVNFGGVFAGTNRISCSTGGTPFCYAEVNVNDDPGFSVRNKIMTRNSTCCSHSLETITAKSGPAQCSDSPTASCETYTYTNNAGNSGTEDYYGTPRFTNNQIATIAVPASGHVLTVTYQVNGWNAGGTGLMDEDGRPAHTWLGTDPDALSNANVNFAVDCRAWLGQLATTYFSAMQGQIAADFTAAGAAVPMYIGPDSFGTWATPPRKEVLQGAAPYLGMGIMGGSSGYSLTQSELDFLGTWFGKPFLSATFLHSQADSPFANNPLPDDYATQELRGAAFVATIQGLLSVRTGGLNPYVGNNWWSYADMTESGGTNWGLVTFLDNAYDGHETVTGRVTCSVPFQAYSCGGETVNSGDVITSVKNANSLWTSR